MRFLAGRLLLPLAVIVLVVLAFVFIWRARSGEAYGPAVALCPGPDRYGYTCEGAAAYAYIDATIPTGLIADDDVIRLDLPFPFLFYGKEYESLNAATNGNLQFTSASALAFPACLNPAAGMGDLISPYWADLDFRLYGTLETAVVGEAPARIFVVEWDDVPLYGLDTEDRVTFEAQLFEGSNDIVFLYQDPTTIAGGNGGRAVVGIQSESQGLSLSFSCLQPVVPAGGGLRFPHPSEPNLEAADPAETAPNAASVSPIPTVKGPVAELIAGYANEGAVALESLRVHWFSGRPQQSFDWRATDLTGDGRDELVAVWRGRVEQPQIARVAVLATEGGQLTPLFDQALSTREAAYSEIVIEDVADLTGDGAADVLLRDRPTGRMWALTAVDGNVALLDVPEQCHGGLIVQDEGGRPVIVRDGCPTAGRVRVVWDGREFVRQ